MEPQQQNEEIINPNGGKLSSSSTTSNNGNSYLCRQSSSRWTPTTEQIKLLKELYYINGVRSPSADQIQTICSRLRRYGKIEGKNVFYWFQNHKARERQKKRLTPTTSSSTNTLLPTTIPQFLNNNSNFNNNTNNNSPNDNHLVINGDIAWKPEQDHRQDITLHAKHPYTINNNNPGVSCSSSSNGVVSGGGQFMGNFGYGAVNMENKFRDCSISSGGGYVLNNGGNQMNQWTNYNPYATPASYSNFLDKISTIDEEEPYVEQDHHHCYGVASPQIETLPLFPMHNDNHGYDHDHDYDHGFYTFRSPSDGYYTGGYRWSNGGGGNASLELSLNSYGYGCYSQNL